MGTESVTVRSGPRAGAPRRRFRLLDAMILVAATAVGCGAREWVGRATDDDLSWSALAEGCQDLVRRSGGEGWADVGRDALGVGLTGLCFTMPLVAAWTLALIPIRLLGPRPGLRRLGRQPGLAATSAAAAAVGFIGLLVAVAALAVGREYAVMLAESAVAVFGPILVGLAVVGSWTALLVGRRWRAEASWVDRLGRAVGVFWVVAGSAVTGFLVYEQTASVCQFRARTITPPPAVGAGPVNVDNGPTPFVR